jgi:hypothetical protein
MRGNGERIGPQNLPTSSVAGGVWNLLNQQRAQQRGAWPSATPAVTTDPYFMYVPLLLNTTSTNGQQNNTFLDSSSNAFTITRNGTPTQGAFTPYQPNGYWSGYFNGSTDNLSAASNAAFGFGTGDFTIELWAYVANTSNAMSLVDLRNGTEITTNPLLYMAIGGGISWLINGAVAISSAAITANSWVHIAVSRSSSSTKLFVNGTQAGSTYSDTNNYTQSSAFIGRGSVATTLYVNGYLSNVRLVKGTAVYTANFTPPTTPLTAITNTSLLTLQSNRFIDNSTNAFAITVNGTPKVQAFQPFAPAASYSAATYGGSGYFSTSNYLTAPASTSWQFTGDYTLEAWIYLVSLADGTIYGTGGAGASDQFTYTSTGQLYWANQGTSAGVITTNQWLHVAAARSGTTLKIFVNGVTQLTATVSGTTGQNLTAYIARRSDGGNPVNGYISNLRIVNGTAVYTANFTPPTAPVTAITNTSLLLNMTNAGIYDAAWQNNALTVGDAQVSTTQAQWPTTSMKFDGTGDYLDILGPNPAFNLSSGDWTIEAWIYRSVANANHCVLNLINASGSNSGLSFYVNSSNQLATDNGSAGALSGGTVPANQWVYLAIVRSSGTTTGYVNGTSIGTTTQAPATAQYARIGGLGGGGSPFNGYIQDLRITKGVARTITTPTAAFPTR